MCNETENNMQQLILAIIAFTMGTIVGILYMDAVDRKNFNKFKNEENEY